MNKKISTLLAAFLAAGFSYTVEAGVVKVTTPVAGTKYVVAESGFTGAVGKLLLQASSATAFGGVAGNTAIDDAALWIPTVSAPGYTLANANSSYASSVITQSTTTAAFAASGSAVVFSLDADGKLLSQDVTNHDFVLAATPAFAATGANASFYTVTEASLTESTTGTYITIDNKYLVNDNGTAKLVNATEYAIAGYTDADAKWTVSAEGVIANGGKAIKTITATGAGVYTVTLDAEASGVALEKDKYNTTSTVLYMGTAAVTNADVTKIAEVANAPVPVTADATADRVAFKAGSPFMLHVNNQNGFVSKAENGVIAATNQASADDDFYWTANEVETGVYTFTNNTGEQINLNGIYKFKVVSAGTNLFYLVTTDGANAIELSSTTLALGTGTGSAAVFSFHKIASTDYQAGQLVKKLGDGFNLSIKSKKGDDGVSNFKFNPFQGKLTPVKITRNASSVVTGFEAYKATDLTSASSFLLQCADGIIVLDKSTSYPIEGIKDFANGNGGFVFKIYSKDDMKDLLNATAGTEAYKLLQKTEYNFSISYPNSSDLSEIELIKIGSYRVISYGNDSEYYLSAGLQSGNIGTPVYATFDGNALVKSTDEENNPLLLGYVNLVFQSSNVKVNGNALAMDHNTSGNVIISPVEISNVVLGKPEAQWAVTANAAKVNEFTFTNRESGKSFTVDNMYYMGGNKYAVAYPAGTNTYAYPSDITAVRDTLVIAGTEVERGVQMDGYANLTALDVLDNQYRLAVASTSNTDFYVTENHSGKHLLGLDKDEDAAATWKLVPLTNAREFNSFGDIKTATDSIYIMNEVGYYNAKGQYKEYKDTLAIISYALQNAKNGEYLTYQNPQTLKNLSMICDPKSTDYTTSKDLKAAYRFVLKEKQNGLYNLVGVSQGSKASDEFKLDPAHKLFGATTAESGAVEVKAMYKDINSNDLFDLQLVGAPEYRLHNMGDTIRIFRQENDYDVMYEKGEFLNIGNKAQLTTMAPALYVDTAYVKRGHNNRYQYLLVVNPKYVPEQECTIPGHPTIHPDTTYGRFLVNLVDTANVAYRKGAIHTNKYINEGEAGEIFAKLGFVYGFRTADKLYITDKSYVKSGKASDVIDLSTNNFNVAKFAFQYINPINHESDGSFKIQTGYYDYNSYIANNKQPKVSNDGYLKNINGVVVVAKGYEAGDKFDLAAEHSNPTANEGINASEVTIIAGEGTVTINGAQGKKVTISNVLGQTVANTVISSDKAEIAAPAGVVVVAVEGEAAVKAIVK